MPDQLAPEIVASISRRLAQHAGLELPAWVVEARASARIAALAIAPDDYVELIGSTRGTGELDELIEAVRVGESRLFRHRSQINALVDVVVPALKAKHRRAVRVWSAGCAAGEEPYTLAAILSHAMPGVAVTIVATDVSADALELAKRARYPAAAWNDIPEQFRGGFTRDGEHVCVAPDVAQLVRFERANLAAQLEQAPRGCDLVWCRNVLIYFTPAARRMVIDRLVGALSPGGFLFVGYSESLRDTPTLEARRAGDASYYVKREDGDRVSDPRMPPPAGLRRMPPAAPPTPAHGIAISRTMTPGVLVVHGVTRTPSSGLPVVAKTNDTLVLKGMPNARDVTAELTARLASPGLRQLVIDLDTAELLGDELAPVLRRARAAARTANVELVLRATRTGSRRWLTRHQLDEDER